MTIKNTSKVRKAAPRIIKSLWPKHLLSAVELEKKMILKIILEASPKTVTDTGNSWQNYVIICIWMPVFWNLSYSALPRFTFLGNV